MREGFYSIAVAGGDRAPDNDEAFGIAILAHFRDGRFVGVDQGGCKVSGEYKVDADDRLAIRLIYDFKAGSERINGMTIHQDTRHEADLLLAPGAADGAPQPVDIGLGPNVIRMNWLAEPV